MIESNDAGNGSSFATSDTAAAAGFASMSPFWIILRLLFPPQILLPLHLSLQQSKLLQIVIFLYSLLELSHKALDEGRKESKFSMNIKIYITPT